MFRSLIHRRDLQFIGLALALGGIAAGSFFFVRVLTGGSGQSAAEAVPSTFPQPPGPDVTPIPDTTPDTTQPWWYVPYLNAERDKPLLDSTVAGIRIGPDVDPSPSCNDETGAPGTLANTRGTRFDLELPYQPPKTTRQPGSEYVILCDGQVVSSEADYTVGADPAGAPFGGSFKVYRHTGKPLESVSIPAERWKESTISGLPAAVAAPILDDIGLGQGAVVQYRDGVVIKVASTGIPLDQLIKIAEGVAE